MLPNRLQTAANTAAIYAAALCLLVAPFRGATGLRAALLVLAMLFIAVAAAVRREWRWLLPLPRMVRNSVAAWALALLAGSLMTSNHWRALDSWKGDVLTPLLALLVFYALTNTEADMKRWLKILFLGLIGLTSFAIWNVFFPVDAVTMPAFGGMGPYSTWLVTLCALLPLAWASEVEAASTVRPLSSSNRMPSRAPSGASPSRNQSPLRVSIGLATGTPCLARCSRNSVSVVTSAAPRAR